MSDPILVTGATGFTGGALARELVKRGHRVRALVRSPKNAGDLTALGVELVEGDIRDAEAVDGAVKGCKIVYHVAAVFRTAGHPDSYYHEVNAHGVELVLDSARKHGVERTVHCSTVGVHGHVAKLPSDESAPYNPGDIYQETKLAGELIAQKAIARGQPVSIFRPAGIYGPGDLRFLKLFKTVQNRTFRMFGTGEITYHLTYIDDLVQGILLCGEHPAALGEIFILCGDDYVTLNEFVRTIAETLDVSPPKGHLPLWPLLAAAQVCEWICKPIGINPPLHKRRCEFFIKARAFTNRKARNLLGFSPGFKLREGIEATAHWYCSQGLLVSTQAALRRNATHIPSNVSGTHS